tara:strand:- start:129 stop:854 length:726 start_codon:yes stop_codon:yes gene_type:complete
MELSEDYLEADKEIRGQNYVCLSFISPENVLKDKEMFKVHNFLQSIATEYNLQEEEIVDKYKDYLFNEEEHLNKQFTEKNNFKTSVRGLKVRGTYDTIQEAEMRAKRLQKSDPNFNVFVGQVGFWLPWDPEPQTIEKENYLNDELNTLMSKYKENMDEREEIFNTRKRDLIEKNNLEVEQKQAELAELEKNKDQVKELADVLEAEDPWLNRQQTKSSESSHVVEPVNLVEELNKSKKLTIN